MRDTTPAPAHAVDNLQSRIGRSHFIRLLTAFLLAIVTWGWVTQATDPIKTVTYAEMDISTPSLSSDLVIVTSLPRAKVIVEGPTSELADINRSVLSVGVDVSRITEPGEYSLPLVVDAPESDARITTDPETVLVQVDAVASKVIPLQVELSGEESTTSEVTTITPSFSQVTVTGPSSAVDRVASVILPVTISNPTGSFSAVLTPYAIDAQDQVVSEVTILPNQIVTQVEIQSRGKVINVIADVQGQPADGYVIQGRAVLPNSITVEGSEEALAGLLFVNTEPVDVTGASQSVSQKVSLVGLPEGVTVIDPIDGQVEVRVAIQDSSATEQTLSGLPVTAINVPDGYLVTIVPESVDVTLQGSTTVLSQMTEEDISVIVDVGSLETGTYELTPVVALPDNGVTNRGVTPGTIEVTLSLLPGGTPEEQNTPAAGGSQYQEPMALSPDSATGRTRRRQQ
ncbi:MAG: hypothetical protein KC435_07335 [Thermomicrobiales bacterium]|nr:hypothetical protein [Thermomicrobiales bacterium]